MNGYNFYTNFLLFLTPKFFLLFTPICWPTNHSLRYMPLKYLDSLIVKMDSLYPFVANFFTPSWPGTQLWHAMNSNCSVYYIILLPVHFNKYAFELTKFIFFIRVRHAMSNFPISVIFGYFLAAISWREYNYFGHPWALS